MATGAHSTHSFPCHFCMKFLSFFSLFKIEFQMYKLLSVNQCLVSIFSCVELIENGNYACRNKHIFISPKT